MLSIQCALVNAHPAYGIAKDNKGNIYFADITHHQRGTVWKINTKGRSIPILKDFHAHNINVDKFGNIYTAHGEDTQVLLKIDPNGVKDTLIYTEDISMFFGGNCSVSPNGRVYFGIDHYIWKVDVKGKVTKASGYLEWNQGFYVDEHEIIYAMDIGVGNGSIFKIEPNGKQSLIADQLISFDGTKPDLHADILLGITKGVNQDIFVCDLGGRRIVRIDIDGGCSTYYTAESGWYPTGIFIDEANTFILEFGIDNKGPRIVSIPNGTQKIIYEHGKELKVTPESTSKGKSVWVAILLLMISCSYFLVPFETKGY